MSEQNMMRELSFREMTTQYRLIIPEIQREYVWGDNQIGTDVLKQFYMDLLQDFDRYKIFQKEVLEKFIELKNSMSSAVDGGLITEDQLKENARKKVIDSNGGEPSTNVGFVYAYVQGLLKVASDIRHIPANLIDGQQRVTTYFLVLLWSARKSNRMREFMEWIQIPNEADGRDLSFDFKVRMLTHEFLCQLLSNVLEQENFDFSNIGDATWYLNEYQKDVSIRSMTNALKVWEVEWGIRNKDEASLCYDFLLNNVKFMFWPIGNPEQGEQLYITMNGRGKNLSEDEIVRARIYHEAVDAGRTATEVGSVIESINDFFWTHRVKNELTADKGVKKFFRWIYLLERFEKDSRTGRNDKTAFSLGLQAGAEFRLQQDMFKKGGITFDLIRTSFESLQRLYGVKSSAKAFVTSSILDDPDSAQTFQLDCFLILPLLQLINSKPDVSDEEIGDMARYLRKMATKSDVRKEPARAVPHGILFVKEYVASRELNLLYFLRTLMDDKYKTIPEMLKPDEEIHKAKRLVSILEEESLPEEERRSLFSDFLKKIEEIEAYKSCNGGKDPFAGDYRIGGFLKLEENWENIAWTHDLIEKYQCCFDKIKQFFENRNSSRRMWLLLTNDILGYDERRSRFVPRQLADLMEETALLKSILEFENLVSQRGEDGESLVFNDMVRQYLHAHWGNRAQEGVVRVLCAEGIALHMLAHKQIDKDWLNVEYHVEYYNGNKESLSDASKRACGSGGYYFWFQEKNAPRWRYSDACEGNLFYIHSISDAEADSIVQTFLASGE